MKKPAIQDKIAIEALEETLRRQFLAPRRAPNGFRKGLRNDLKRRWNLRAIWVGYRTPQKVSRGNLTAQVVRAESPEGVGGGLLFL